MGHRSSKDERRYKCRFPIEQDVRYKVAEPGALGAVGSGHTINVSSGGVAFVSEQPLALGSFVELSMSWPVMLEENCRMRLVAFGRILRCNGRKAVCSIEKYEFRTQSRSLKRVAPRRTDGMLQRWVQEIRRGNEKLSAVGA
jgi:hypothetical protein